MDIIIFNTTGSFLDNLMLSYANFLFLKKHRIFYICKDTVKIPKEYKNYITFFSIPKNFHENENYTHILRSFFIEKDIHSAIMYNPDYTFNNICKALSSSYGFNLCAFNPYISFDENYTNMLNFFPLISIIILTLNNFEYTEKCINSILNYTHYRNYEIIIVDNGSNVFTIDKMQNLIRNRSNISLIKNNKNLGFAAGNNIGIKSSKGSFIVLLNNDTIVTKGWLCTLFKHLKNPLLNCGLIGPVTNCSSGPSKISITYNNIDAMHIFAKEIFFKNLSSTPKSVPMLPMFCTMFSRNLLTRVGYLDENYIVGTFEDDDYSYRVLKAGYSILIAQDVFIHHFGSKTMNTLSKEKIMDITRNNLNYFEKKWNTKWSPRKK